MKLWILGVEKKKLIIVENSAKSQVALKFDLYEKNLCVFSERLASIEARASTEVIHS